MSTNRCKNCNQLLLLHQKYCHECGQRTDTHRINFHFLVHEFQHSILHVDGGLLYTLKQLFTRPGHSLREYLAGKRRDHFKPVLLIIILGSLCGLAKYFSSNTESNIKVKTQFENNKDFKNLGKFVDLQGIGHYFTSIVKWLTDHLAFTILFMIPVTAFSFYLGFRKYKVNYAEWLVLMCFMAGQILVLYLLIIILNYFFVPAVSAIVYGGMIAVSFWTLLQFFNTRKKSHVFWRIIWSYFITYCLNVIFITIVAITVALIGFIIFGNENLLKELKNS